METKEIDVLISLENHIKIMRKISQERAKEISAGDWKGNRPLSRSFFVLQISLGRLARAMSEMVDEEESKRPFILEEEVEKAAFSLAKNAVWFLERVEMKKGSRDDI